MKTHKEQQAILSLSAQKAENLHKQHHGDEEKAVAQQQIILQEFQVKKAEAEKKKRDKLTNIMNN